MVSLVLGRHVTHLGKGGPIVHTAGKIGQRVPGVRVVRWRGVLSLGARAVLPGGARAGGGATSHWHSVHPAVVLLGRLDQIAEKVVIGEVCVVNQSLQVEGDLLCCQLGKFSSVLCVLGEGLHTERSWVHPVVVTAPIVVVVVVVGAAVVVG